MAYDEPKWQALQSRWTTPPRVREPRRLASRVAEQQEGAAFMAFMGAVNG